MTDESALGTRRADSAPGVRRYAVKAVWRTLQGEGAWAGRPAVFVRFAGCNLWSGHDADRRRDADRSGADCPRWCFSPETPVLMDDYTTRPIGRVRVGTRVMGAEIENGHVRLSPTVVRHVMRREASLSLIRLDNATITGTSDHSVLTRPQTSRERVAYRRVREAVGRHTYSLLGKEPPPSSFGSEFWRGWLAGVAFGDGCFWTLRKRDRVRSTPYDRAALWVPRTRTYRRFRLAMHDDEVLDTFERKAITHGFDGWNKGIHRGTGHNAYVMRSLTLTRSEAVETFERYLTPRPDSSRAYKRGFLAGFIDAEGHIRNRGITIHQSRHANADLCHIVDGYFADLGFSPSVGGDAWSIYGQDSLRLLIMCPPVITRKVRRFDGRSLGQCYGLIEAVEDMGVEGTVVNLTTETGNYVAAGHVVKNCDTDFTKDGAAKLSAADLVEEIQTVGGPVRFVVLTGGEPFLQADAALVTALHDAGYEVAVETNGTIALADAFRDETGDLVPPDWIVCSPKLPEAALKLEACDELKLVVPDYRPDAYARFAARVRPHRIAGWERRYLWLQPEDGPRREAATRLAVETALAAPAWRVSVQTHKLLDID